MPFSSAEKETNRTYKRENLVVLVYADNTLYTRVFPPDHPEVQKHHVIIYENEGIWSAPHNSDSGMLRQIPRIGEKRYIAWGCRYGAIGVYDCTNLEHLNSMLCHAKEATDPPPSQLDD